MPGPRTWLAIGLGIVVLGGSAGVVVYSRRAAPPGAEQALAAGRPRDALMLLRNRIRDNPRDGEAYLLLGRVDAQLGDLLAAEKDLKRARGAGAARDQVLFELGRVYLAQRRYDDVLAEVPRSDVKAEVAGRYLALRGRAYLGLGDVAKAAETLAAAKALTPGEPELLVSLAKLAVAQNDMAAARSEAEAALAADPVSPTALVLLTQLLAASGDRAAALAMAARAIGVSPGDPVPRIMATDLRLETNDLVGARREVNALRALQPRSQTASYWDGVVMVREGRFQEASELFNGMGAAAARFPRGTYYKAVAALGQGLASTAVAAAELYVGQAPGDGEGVRLLARAQAVNRRPDLAVATLRAAVARGVNDAPTLDDLGVSLAGQGDLRGARGAFESALAKAPADQDVMVHLALLRVQEGDASGAAAQLQGARAESPPALEALVTAQIAAGDTVGAGETLERLRAKAGATETVGVLGGLLAMERQDIPAAIASFAAAAKAFPASPAAAIDLSNALLAAGRREEASAALSDLLARDPANPAALSGFVQLGLQYGQPAAAIRAIEAARVAAPDNAGLLVMLADVQVRVGNPTAAIRAIEAVRQGQALPAVLDALARAQVAAARPQDAERSYREALDAGPDVQAALGLAGLQMARHDAAAAADTLDRAVKRMPGTSALLTRRVQIETERAGVEAGLVLAAALHDDPAQRPASALLPGDALMRAGRPKEAAQAFRREWGDRNAATGLRLGTALIAAGDSQGALQVLQTLPDEPDAAILRSQIATAERRWPEVAAELERAAKARPRDPAVLNNLAWAYQMLRDPRAATMARRAFLLDPAPENADTLGWAILQQGTAQQALPLLQQAASRLPADPAVAYHLAVALERDGKPAEAAVAVKTALSGGAAFDERRDAEALLGTLGKPR